MVVRLTVLQGANVAYFCKLHHGPPISCFQAFDPQRDTSSATNIYWLCTNDGLFYSYDQITYNDGPKWELKDDCASYKN